MSASLRLASTIAFVALAATGARGAEGVEITGVRQEFKVCRQIAEPDARLKCYDALQAKLERPTFQGSHAEDTPSFVVSKPTLLRYQSDGPIFVMYLKDDKDVVVQNLHIGGGGESSWLITKPGTYSLSVSGTDTWRIWVEPQGAVAPRG